MVQTTFQNPFLSPFSSQIPSHTSGQQTASGGVAFSYENDFHNNFKNDFSQDFDRSVQSTYQHDFGDVTWNDDKWKEKQEVQVNSHSHHDVEAGTRHLSSTKTLYESTYYTPEVFKHIKDQFSPPLLLILRPKGLIDAELYDPATDQVIYRSYHTGRPSFSNQPDVRLYRVATGDENVGDIRFSGRTTTIKKTATGKIWNKVDTIDSRQYLAPEDETRTFVWTQTNTQPRYIRGRWCATDYTSLSHLWSEDDYLGLALIDSDRPWIQPLCTVKMYNTLPSAAIEVWMQNVYTDRVNFSDWAILDELILFAYANMEQTRRRITKKARSTENSLALDFNWGSVCVATFTLGVALFLLIWAMVQLRNPCAIQDCAPPPDFVPTG